MTGYILLQQENVNSDNEVFLNLTDLDYSWSGLTNSTPVPGKWDTVESDVGGFENPQIVVSGVVDLGDSSLVDVDNDGTSETPMSIPLMLDFAQVRFTGNNPIKLTVATGGDGTTNVFVKGRPGDGYSVGGTYRDFIYVIVDSFSFNITSETINERRLNFNITFVETTKRDEDLV